MTKPNHTNLAAPAAKRPTPTSDKRQAQALPALIAAVENLRDLLLLIGRGEFRAYGYASQLRRYRRSLCAGNVVGSQEVKHAP